MKGASTARDAREDTAHGTARRCLAPGAALLGLLCLWHTVGGFAGSRAFHAAWAAAVAVPFAMGLHAGQSALSAAGWRVLMDARRRPGFLRTWRLRALRESLDTLLPLTPVAGEIAAAASLRRAGTDRVEVATALLLDTASELAGQVLYLALALAVAAPLLGGPRAAFGAMAAVALLVALLALATRSRPLRLAAFAVRRLAPRRGIPLADEIEAISRAVSGRLGSGQGRRTLAAAIGLHFGHWLLGALETMLFFAALGAHASLAQAVAVNGIGVAARSLGAAVPGSAGVQEGGFVLAGAMLGLPADLALAASLLRRFREFGFALAALPLLRLGRAARGADTRAARPPVALPAAEGAPA